MGGSPHFLLTECPLFLSRLLRSKVNLPYPLSGSFPHALHPSLSSALALYLLEITMADSRLLSPLSPPGAALCSFPAQLPERVQVHPPIHPVFTSEPPPHSHFYPSFPRHGSTKVTGDLLVVGVNGHSIFSSSFPNAQVVSAPEPGSWKLAPQALTFPGGSPGQASSAFQVTPRPPLSLHLRGPCTSFPIPPPFLQA